MSAGSGYRGGVFARLRHISRLPLSMVVGKARHAVATRLLAPRTLRVSPPPDMDWYSAFTAADISAFAAVFRSEGDRFASTCSALHDGEFQSLGHSHCFGSPATVRWGDPQTGDPGDSRWQHDLAYFFFAVPLMAAEPERGIKTLSELVRALDRQLAEDPSDLRRFHWTPIAVACRTLALATALAVAPPEVLRRHQFELAAIGAHVWRAAEFLGVTVERYLGFNHGAFTEAGLAIGRLVQGRTVLARRSVHRLVQGLERDTLRDGMWAERSPTYHIHMLILVDAVRAFADASASRRLTELGTRMRTALGTVVHPDGEIAIFNDAATADAPSPMAVGWQPAQIPAESVLPAAGYARVQRDSTVLIMDAGPMGPDAVIGHGHADFLAVEVSIGGNRLIVDPGVASITAGSERQWTRSAHSHNGPALGGREPAEFFGAYRVGRRGTAWFEAVSVEPLGAVSLEGRCNGYRKWGVMVSRAVRLDCQGRLRIQDRWEGKRTCSASVSFLVAGDWALEALTDDEARFRHLDGTAAALGVATGSLQRPLAASHFIDGPTRARPATLLVIVARDGEVTTTITPI